MNINNSRYRLLFGRQTAFTLAQRHNRLALFNLAEQKEEWI